MQVIFHDNLPSVATDGSSLKNDRMVISQRLTFFHLKPYSIQLDFLNELPPIDRSLKLSKYNLCSEHLKLFIRLCFIFLSRKMMYHKNHWNGSSNISYVLSVVIKEFETILRVEKN